MSTVIVVLIVVVVAIGLILESTHKQTCCCKRPQSSCPDAQDGLSADEAAPTQTGLFRAQQVLRKGDEGAQQKPHEQQSKSLEEAPSKEEDVALPDPFAQDD